MLNVCVAYVYVKMVGMAMVSIACTIARLILFGASIDVCQSTMMKSVSIDFHVNFPNEKLIFIFSSLSEEIDPFCHIQGCTCPTGYELIETEETKICRLIDQATELQPEEKREFCDDELSCELQLKIRCSCFQCHATLSSTVIKMQIVNGSKVSCGVNASVSQATKAMVSRASRKKLRVCLRTFATFTLNVFTMNWSANRFASAIKATKVMENSVDWRQNVNKARTVSRTQFVIAAFVCAKMASNETLPICKC